MDPHDERKMKRVRGRYLLIRYDPKTFTRGSLKRLLSSLSEDASNAVPHFRCVSFVLEEGLAVLSIPHVHVSKTKSKLASSSQTAEVVLISGTLEGLKRKIRTRGVRKGLFEPRVA